ncbi:Exodeoxyribonuclease VII small subunit [hydrothermal vent metagenome]|uniref:Exodeoxyribonuclease VII small subunit n=1 Tax=hydrothermal vent metagenome TaxID=652676 RepID=A0A1W1D556_9ZZZZ
MAKQKFETKIENAKKILQTLMDPEITLEASVKAYDKGIKELKDAQKILEEAQLKVQEIKSDI